MDAGIQIYPRKEDERRTVMADTENFAIQPAIAIFPTFIP
jgi:hypothetical protein